jgi:hypothetical protein
MERLGGIGLGFAEVGDRAAWSEVPSYKTDPPSALPGTHPHLLMVGVAQHGWVAAAPAVGQECGDEVTRDASI